MAKSAVMVWDCGATNYRAVVVDTKGNILGQARSDNQAVKQKNAPDDRRIWDIESIYADLCKLTTEVSGKLDDVELEGLTVTTWGADGAPMDADGNLLYRCQCYRCVVLHSFSSSSPRSRLQSASRCRR